MRGVLTTRDAGRSHCSGCGAFSLLGMRGVLTHCSGCVSFSLVGIRGVLTARDAGAISTRNAGRFRCLIGSIVENKLFDDFIMSFLVFSC